MKLHNRKRTSLCWELTIAVLTMNSRAPTTTTTKIIARSCDAITGARFQRSHAQWRLSSTKDPPYGPTPCSGCTTRGQDHRRCCPCLIVQIARCLVLVAFSMFFYLLRPPLRGQLRWNPDPQERHMRHSWRAGR